MEVKGLAHFGLEVSNVENSAKFYTEVFQGKELKRLGFSEEELKKGRTRHVMVKVGNMVVALFESRERGKMEPRGIAPNDPQSWPRGWRWARPRVGSLSSSCCRAVHSPSSESW